MHYFKIWLLIDINLQIFCQFSSAVKHNAIDSSDIRYFCHYQTLNRKVGKTCECV